MSMDEDLARDQRAVDATVHAGNGAPARWQYRVVVLDSKAPMDHLNGFGHLGWELASVTATPQGERAYFKRSACAIEAPPVDRTKDGLVDGSRPRWCIGKTHSGDPPETWCGRANARRSSVLSEGIVAATHVPLCQTCAKAMAVAILSRANRRLCLTRDEQQDAGRGG